MVQRVTLNRLRPPVELVSKRQIAEMLNVDCSTLDRWRREGRFPEGIAISDQILRWRLTDIEDWLRQREDAR